ncbi:MAG: hypothetical protein V4629_07250 [Pseudomonadota bacterium]
MNLKKPGATMSKKIKQKLKLNFNPKPSVELKIVEQADSIYKEVDPIIRDLAQLCCVMGLKEGKTSDAIDCALSIFTLPINRSIYPLLVACDLLNFSLLPKMAKYIIGHYIKHTTWLTDDQKAALKLKQAMYLEFGMGSKTEIEKLKFEASQNATIAQHFDFSKWNQIEECATEIAEEMELPL